MVANMPRTQVLVQLDAEQVDALDRIADASDGNRSELIRRAIDVFLEAAEEAVEDIRYAQAYQRLPEDLSEDSALRELSMSSWPAR
jgi:predicted transcriptional regulator